MSRQFSDLVICAGVLKLPKAEFAIAYSSYNIPSTIEAGAFLFPFVKERVYANTGSRITFLQRLSVGLKKRITNNECNPLVVIVEDGLDLVITSK